MRNPSVLIILGVLAMVALFVASALLSGPVLIVVLSALLIASFAAVAVYQRKEG